MKTAKMKPTTWNERAAKWLSGLSGRADPQRHIIAAGPFSLPHCPICGALFVGGPHYGGATECANCLDRMAAIIREPRPKSKKRSRK